MKKYDSISELTSQWRKLMKAEKHQEALKIVDLHYDELGPSVDLLFLKYKARRLGPSFSTLNEVDILRAELEDILKISSRFLDVVIELGFLEYTFRSADRADELFTEALNEASIASIDAYRGLIANKIDQDDIPGANILYQKMIEKYGEDYFIETYDIYLDHPELGEQEGDVDS